MLDKRIVETSKLFFLLIGSKLVDLNFKVNVMRVWNYINNLVFNVFIKICNNITVLFSFLVLIYKKKLKYLVPNKKTGYFLRRQS